jgi:hypothetical protein
MSEQQALPGADEKQTRRIVKWHAQGHDALDDLGVPRMADGLSYTIAERIRLLSTPEEGREEDG